jgi:hypothetical protein
MRVVALVRHDVTQAGNGAGREVWRQLRERDHVRELDRRLPELRSHWKVRSGRWDAELGN